MVVINNKLALEVLKSVYEHCKEIFGNKLHDAFLYGSYARGDYDTGSDIDILVTVDMDYKEIESLRSLLSIYTSRLSLKYDITVSATVKPYEQFKRYSEVLPYYANVIKEGINYAEL